MARDFNGSSDYITVTDAASLDSTSALTVSVWAWADTNIGGTGNREIVRKNGNYILRQQYVVGPNTARLWFIWWDGTNLKYVEAATPTTGAWHHIVGIASGNDASKIYIDGVDSAGASASLGAGSRVLTNNVILGSEVGGGYWDGGIAEVAIDDAAWTADQVQTVYRKGPFALGLELGAYLPIFGAASPEPDWSGNGNSGALTGTSLKDHPPVARPFDGANWWPGAFTSSGGAAATPKLIGGNLIRPNLVRGRLAA
jgi:hypothetical protein